MTDTYLIFAPDDQKADTAAILSARRVPMRALDGVYKGQKERAFMVHLADMLKTADLWSGQESVLILGESRIDGSRHALLVFVRERQEPVNLGYWREIEAKQTRFLDAYSIDTFTGKAYHAK